MSSADPNSTAQLPQVRPGRGPRRYWPVAVLAVLVLGGLGLAALVDGGDPPASEIATVTVPSVPVSTEPAPTSTTTVPPASTSTTRPPERLSGESRLSLDGVGPVHVGMTLEEASQAAGTPIRIHPSPFGPECQYAGAEGIPSVSFMVINGRIARVDSAGPGGSPLKTVSGIGRGSTEDEVKRTYPGRIRVEGHPYVPTGHYLVYVPADPALSHLSMIFETDGREVTRFRAGMKNAVAQIEGCA